MKAILQKIKRNKSLRELAYYLFYGELNHTEEMSKEDIIKESEWVLFLLENDDDEEENIRTKEIKATRKIIQEMKALREDTQ